MLQKKKSSYLDVLSPAKESDTVKEYDPVTEEGQIGKEHEEEVAQTNNWEGDSRDEIGRAAAKKRKLAQKLRRLAREIEAMEKNYQENIEDISEQVKDESVGETPEDLELQDELTEEDIDDDDEEMQSEEKTSKKITSKTERDEFIVLEASHPIEHDPSQDNPSADMSSQTGDDEWIDIGPGTFEDTRDPIGRAANKKK